MKRLVRVTHIRKPVDEVGDLRLRNTFRQYVDRDQLLHVIDLSELKTLESPTISALIAILRIIRSAGGAVNLVANGEVRSALATTALDRIFPVFDKVYEAKQALRKRELVPA